MTVSETGCKIVKRMVTLFARAIRVRFLSDIHWLESPSRAEQQNSLSYGWNGGGLAPALERPIPGRCHRGH